MKFLSALLVPVVFFLDRFTKTAVIRCYAEGEGLAVWPGVFHLTRVNNTGAAFGMMKHSGQALVLVSVFSVFFLTLFVFRNLFLVRSGEIRTRTHLSNLAVFLVIGGALGNLYDRLKYGYVIDFLDFRVWPVFNLADASICIGVFLVLAGLVIPKKEV